ncbi:MAG: glycosyltransferase family 39 protein [Actinomycetota bacterium]|nr:glycosyltransferase family 39 protein [Actinomycetota bacterium]
MSTISPPVADLVGRRARRSGERLRSLVRGRTEDPNWVRPALLGVIALAAVLCLWDLTVSGYANQYYAAAAKSGSESWKAWFFGSLDPGSFITIDKPPLSLWLQDLSARVLGFSSFSLLLPQALATIAAVGLLYATVRRAFGPAAGLIAAGALALTPVTVLMGRYNNPDALLVLLLVASAYLLVRALQSGATKYLVWCGVMVGLAFMTKLLQGWMIVPALGLAYLIGGPVSLRVRIRQLLLAGVAMVLVSAAWPVAVSLWPGSKPYIGGSTNGSVWNLIFGYDGFGRLTGSGGPGGGASFGGAAGLLRMFNAEVGGQGAWLIPLAAIGAGAGLWLRRRAPRTDLGRAVLVLFAVWAVVHIAIFSTQQGIFHPYYVSALAPAVAALAGIGLISMWQWARRSWAGALTLGAGVAVTAVLADVLLARTPSFAPWLRVLIPVAATLAITAGMMLRAGHLASRRGVLAAMLAAAAIALMAGPAAYAVATVGRAYSAGNPQAGPASVAALGGGGPGMPGGGAGGPRFGIAGQAVGGGSSTLAPPGLGQAAGGRPTLGGSRGFAGPAGPQRLGGGPGPGGPQGGVSKRVIAYLEAHQGSAKYLVAGVGSQTTASIIIQTGKPVVTIGGFNGSDPAPTLAQLERMVASGELKYVLLSSGGFGGGGPGRLGSQSAQSISSWVQHHGRAVSGLGSTGATLYAVA